MFNYLVTFYNYIRSFLFPLAAVPVVQESWKDAYDSAKSSLETFAEKLDALDKLFISSSLPNQELETMFSDVFADFRTIQELFIRVKKMPIADDAERLDRNQKIFDVATYLSQESTAARKLYNMAYRTEIDLKQDEELFSIQDQTNLEQEKLELQINEVKQEMLRQEATPLRETIL